MSNRYLEYLVSLQFNMKESDCIQIFGEKQIGIHLYQKFIQSDRNILMFYARLDANNRNFLSEYIETQSCREKS